MIACAAGATTGWRAAGAGARAACDVDSSCVTSADMGCTGVSTHHATHSVTTNLGALMWHTYARVRV
eukprot:2535567-Pleurochrysis_carterae.AAC.2